MTARDIPLFTAWNAPAQLVIPFPLAMDYTRGVRAKKLLGPMFHIRVTEHDKELVDAEALQANLSSAMFCRWVIVQAAREIHLQRTGEAVRIDL